MGLDLIIEHGRVIDGTGEAARPADVGVAGDRIVAMGDLAAAEAPRRLDASGCVVAPGFIDIHNHSDLALLADGRAASMLRQGVTTQVTGNCGLTPAPVHDGVREQLKKMMIGPAHGSWEWTSFGSFLDALRAVPKATHVAPLLGHCAVRAAAVGFDDRAATVAELETMRAHVAEAMEAGAVGMSSGLVYPPGMYCGTEELVELSRVVARFGGIYTSHMRGEASTLVSSVEEALRVGREAGLPVQISHHKAAGRENWGKVRTTYAMIADAARTHDVTYDLYPYTAGSANLSQLLPPWAHAGGPEALLARLRDAAVRPQVVHDTLHGAAGWNNFFRVDWQDIQLAYVHSEPNRWMQGLRVAEAARRAGVEPVELVMDLILADDNRTTMVNFVIADADMEFLLPMPQSIVGTDGRSCTPGGPTGGGQPHPRSYGTFPRVLGRYVREKRLLGLEEAVHKMTGKPAAKLKLDRRGQVREGWFADLAVFDPAAICDRATFESPHQFPEGVRWVVVDGQVALDEGTLSPTLVGRVLTRSC